MENLNYNSNTEEFNIKEIIFKYLGYWKWFLIGTVICLFLAYTYLRYSSEIYQTVAKIKVLDNTKGGMKLPSDVAALFSNSKVNLDNEIEVLKSHRLLERVAYNLNLGTTYFSVGNIKTSELWNEKPFKIIWIDNKDSKIEKRKSLTVELLPNGYKLVSDNIKSETIYKYGQNNSFKGQKFILTLEDNIIISDNSHINYKIVRTPISLVVEGLSSSLQLASTAKMSEVLSLTITGENKDKSKAIINEIINEFNQDGVNDRQLVSQRTIDFETRRTRIQTQIQLQTLRNGNLGKRCRI